MNILRNGLCIYIDISKQIYKNFGNYLKNPEMHIMLPSLKKFPEQLEDAIKIGKKYDFNFHDIKNVIISGMGGSGITGDIISHISKIPFFVNKGYNIPKFSSPSTLFIAVSYSGNTEETIESYKKARKRGCQTLIITSGGKLGKEKNVIFIPSAMQPRAAIGYLLFPIIIQLERIGAIKKIDYSDVIKVVKSMKRRMGIVMEIANSIEGMPIIYGYSILSTIARRWRQQFNENAKLSAFNFSLPECNHNEIESWERNNKNFTCIFLRSRKEAKAIKKRYEFMKKVYGNKAKLMEIFGEGKNEFSEAMYLLYFGDLVSVYKAKIDGIDAVPVNLISKLKEELRK